MRRPVRFVLKLLLVPPLLAAIAGWIVAPWFLHPVRRELTPEIVQEADIAFSQLHTHREEFDVRGSDGAMLRGWKVRSVQPNGDWILLFHGVADNRAGVLEPARVLLLAGYNVVMMDARAHGASEGAMATYGWIERNDTRAIVDVLEAAEHPRHLFALGESMGAGIALQSAAVEPRIEAVVAEASFANLREASYDYASGVIPGWERHYSRQEPGR
jgi:alpha-beta hydrolase superfamily lysophospholipase